MTSGIKFRSDINGLRAIAVAAVVLFHVGVPALKGGFQGVDIFFVISGFLMTQIIASRIDSGEFSTWNFYWMRAVRIIPALAVLVAVLLGAGVMLLEPQSLAQLAKHSVESLTFVSNIFYWSESGYFDAGSKTKWLLHTWSLSVEWQFYLLYPIVLTLIARWSGSARVRLIALALAFCASLGACILASVAFHSANISSFAFYMLPTRAWEMLAGALVSELGARRPASPRASRAIEVGGLALVALGLACFDADSAWPSWHAVAPTLGTAMVLHARSASSLLRWQPLQAIGTISYSIYLWHWPMTVAFAGTELGRPAQIAAILGCSLVLGALSYVAIERTASRRLKGAPTPSLAIGSGAALAAVAASAAVVFLAHGLPDRIRGDRSAFADAVVAGEDRGMPYDRCSGLHLGKLKPCFIGAPSKATVAVIGDSFAEMWYSRASRLVRDKGAPGIAFLTAGGCPPIAGAFRSGPRNDCTLSHRLVMEEASKPQYKHVIYIAMWNAYFNRKADEPRIAVGDGNAALASQAGLDASMRMLEQEIREFQRAGKDVVVATTAPYPDVDVPSKLREAIYRGRAAEGWTYDFDSIVAQSYPVDSRLLGLSGLDVKTIDLRHFFCTDAPCRMLDGPHSLYSDSAHLRASFLAGMNWTPLDSAFMGESASKAGDSTARARKADEQGSQS